MAPEVQACVYTAICQPVLTCGIEFMNTTKEQMYRMESTQCNIIQHGISKRCHNTALLKALNISRVQRIVEKSALSL